MTDDPAITGPRPYRLPHHLTLLGRLLALLRRLLSPPPAIAPLPPPAPSDAPEPVAAPLPVPSPPEPPRAPEVRTRVRLGGPGWCWPMLRAADGRAPVISDGYHPEALFRAWQAYEAGKGQKPPGARVIRSHRGVDVFYERRRPWPTREAFAAEPQSIYRTRGYEILPGTLAVACGPGTVTVARRLATGWCVSVDHGFGVESVCHHLAGAAVKVGELVAAGQALGLVGGTPKSAKLPKGGVVHEHFELWLHGQHFDPQPYMRRWAVLSEAVAAPVEVVVG